MGRFGLVYWIAEASLLIGRFVHCYCYIICCFCRTELGVYKVLKRQLWNTLPQMRLQKSLLVPPANELPRNEALLQEPRPCPPPALVGWGMFIFPHPPRNSLVLNALDHLPISEWNLGSLFDLCWGFAVGVNLMSIRRKELFNKTDKCDGVFMDI